MPLTRDGVAAYFEAYRPRLVGSDVAKDMMNFLLDSTPRFLEGVVPGAVAMPISALIRRAVIATFPGWMRELSDLEQSRVTDVAATAQIKVVMKALARDHRLQMAVLAKLSPLTVPILAPVMFDVPAEDPKVWTPEEAYAHFGIPTPREQYAAILASRTAGAGPQPYEHHHHDPIVAFPVERAEG